MSRSRYLLTVIPTLAGHRSRTAERPPRLVLTELEAES